MADIHHEKGHIIADIQPFPSHPLFKDITGKKFGRILVESYAGVRGKMKYWNCVCDCGARKTVQSSNLKTGCVQSCGCLSRDTHMTHGMTGTPEYRTWAMMLNRCRNIKSKDWDDYGGRGISVCERWESFECFLEDMGKRPSLQHSIERKKNALGYSKDNCVWATAETQARNRRSNRILTVNGRSQCIAEWSSELGIPAGRIADRKLRGWSDDRALSTEKFVN